MSYPVTGLKPVRHLTILPNGRNEVKWEINHFTHWGAFVGYALITDGRVGGNASGKQLQVVLEVKLPLR